MSGEPNAGPPVERLVEVWEIFTPREQFVLARYFGLKGRSEQTLQDIGDLLGVTRQRVGQIKDRAAQRGSDELALRDSLSAVAEGVSP